MNFSISKRLVISILLRVLLIVLTCLLVGCGQQVAKEPPGNELAGTGLSTLFPEGKTPEDWGYKKYYDPQSAMNEAGIHFTLPSKSDSGDFVGAYIGPNSMGHMGVSVWYDNLILSCYKTDGSPIDYGSWAKSMADVSAKGPEKDVGPPAVATQVNGNNGMVWPHASARANPDAGPVDLYWTVGPYSFEILGRKASCNDTTAKEIAKTVAAQ